MRFFFLQAPCARNPRIQGCVVTRAPRPAAPAGSRNLVKRSEKLKGKIASLFISEKENVLIDKGTSHHSLSGQDLTNDRRRDSLRDRLSEKRKDCRAEKRQAVAVNLLRRVEIFVLSLNKYLASWQVSSQCPSLPTAGF